MKENINTQMINYQNPYKRKIKEPTKKNSFKQKTNNTIKSLSEVENFLRNLKKIGNCIKLYKIIK